MTQCNEKWKSAHGVGHVNVLATACEADPDIAVSCDPEDNQWPGMGKCRVEHTSNRSQGVLSQHILSLLFKITVTYYFMNQRQPGAWSKSGGRKYP